jgi:hypothetical protein
MDHDFLRFNTFELSARHFKKETLRASFNALPKKPTTFTATNPFGNISTSTADNLRELVSDIKPAGTCVPQNGASYFKVPANQLTADLFDNGGELFGNLGLICLLIRQLVSDGGHFRIHVQENGGQNLHHDSFSKTNGSAKDSYRVVLPFSTGGSPTVFWALCIQCKTYLDHVQKLLAHFTYISHSVSGAALTHISGMRTGAEDMLKALIGQRGVHSTVSGSGKGHDCMDLAAGNMHVTDFMMNTGTKGEYMHQEHTAGKRKPTHTARSESPGAWYCPRCISMLVYLQYTGNCIIQSSEYWCGFTEGATSCVVMHASEWLTPPTVQLLTRMKFFTAAEAGQMTNLGPAPIVVKFIFDIKADSEQAAIAKLYQTYADLPNWIRSRIQQDETAGNLKRHRKANNLLLKRALDRVT